MYGGTCMYTVYVAPVVDLFAECLHLIEKQLKFCLYCTVAQWHFKSVIKLNAFIRFYLEL